MMKKLPSGGLYSKLVNVKSSNFLNSVSIRRLRSADMAIIAKIDRYENYTPWSLASFDACLVAGYHCFVVVDDQDVPIGFLIASSGAQEAQLLNVGVDPLWRRHGLALRLLRHLIVQLTALQVQIIWLEVRVSNAVAISLYRKFGFLPVATRKNYYATDNGREDAIVMSLDLTCLA